MGEGVLLALLLLASAATVASVPAGAMAAQGRASGTLTIQAGGLPPGQAAQIAVLHGRKVVRSGRIRALDLRLPKGRYRLVVLRLWVSHAGGSVRRGALALPMRRSIPFTIVAHRRARLLARYGTIVNPGVRRVPAGILSVVGDPNDPSGLVLARDGSGVRVGMILTSGPSGALPVGLIARVTRIQHHGRGELVSLTPAPLSSAVPAIVTNTPIELNAVAARGGSSGLGVKVEVNVAGDCGLTGEADMTTIVKLEHVRFSSDIRLSPWGGGPRLDFRLSAHQEVGFRLDTSSGVKCSVPLLEPTLVGVVPVGPIPVPAYVSVPITLNAELTKATHLQARASWNATYGMRTHKRFLSLIPTPFFKARNVSGKVSATSGPELTFEPNIAVEPGIGVPHVGNIHLDAGTGVEFSLKPGECKWGWRIGTFSAEAELGPIKLGTPDFTAKTIPLWRGCQGAGAVSPPLPPPPHHRLRAPKARAATITRAGCSKPIPRGSWRCRSGVAGGGSF